MSITCLLYTSDAADEEDSVDLGGRRIIKKHVSLCTFTHKLFCSSLRVEKVAAERVQQSFKSYLRLIVSEVLTDVEATSLNNHNQNNTMLY